MKYILPVFIFVLSVSQAAATTMSNDSAGIKGKVVDPERLSDLEENPTIASPQPVKPKNTVKRGYAYPTKEKAIGMIVSTGFIDWENLSPTEPALRESIFRFFPGPTSFLTLYVYENHELSSKEEAASIPDTTCDDGACNELTASVWSSQLTYGFGYRCDSTTRICEKDFSEPSYFRKFPNSAHDDLPAYVLKTGKQNDEAKLTYKVNVSGSQKETSYENEVIFIAAPTY